LTLGHHRAFGVAPQYFRLVKRVEPQWIKRWDWFRIFDPHKADAAKRAFVALPVPLPSADSPEEQRESAWDLMIAKAPLQQTGGGKVDGTRLRRPALGVTQILIVRLKIGPHLPDGMTLSWSGTRRN
jgi:hypothetical protein